jgi:GNAT superfamily N-acetyltransferase
MVEIVSLRQLTEFKERPGHPSLPPFELAKAALDRPDIHVVVSDGTRITARASLWWNGTPPLPNQRAGVVGHYAASSLESSSELMEACCSELRARGCTMAIGPMNGNTWRKYRLLTQRGDEPPFFLEPDNSDEWPGFWTAAGFTPLATYFSALNSDLSHTDPQVTRAGKRLYERDVRVRPLDTTRFEEELRRIYSVSAKSFTENFLYTPISEEEFLRQYSAIQSRIVPKLVLVAEQDNEPVGYLFALPDFLSATRGKIDTAIIKTVAVLPERRCAGLGVWLVQEAQRVARELGYTRAIHALMHESNNSLNLSARYAKPFRRYTLFSRNLL